MEEEKNWININEAREQFTKENHICAVKKLQWRVSRENKLLLSSFLGFETYYSDFIRNPATELKACKSSFKKMPVPVYHLGPANFWPDYEASSNAIVLALLPTTGGRFVMDSEYSNMEGTTARESSIGREEWYFVQNTLKASLWTWYTWYKMPQKWICLQPLPSSKFDNQGLLLLETKSVDGSWSAFEMIDKLYTVLKLTLTMLTNWANEYFTASRSDLNRKYEKQGDVIQALSSQTRRCVNEMDKHDNLKINCKPGGRICQVQLPKHQHLGAAPKRTLKTSSIWAWDLAPHFACVLSMFLFIVFCREIQGMNALKCYFGSVPMESPNAMSLRTT